MEDVPISVWPQWLAQRSAYYHPDRTTASGAQVFYSRPLRMWIAATRVSPTHMRAMFSSTCPCALS